METPSLDLTAIIGRMLARDRRNPDGMLHPSSSLVGSLRHAQLGVAGAPENPRALVQDIRMYTGTMWHERLEQELRGRLVATEVDLTPWMPVGWSGTADILAFSDDYEAWELIDLKTIKGEGIRFVAKDGAKDEHIWQVSAYWYACESRGGKGFPMRERAFVYYLPMNDARGKVRPEPVTADFEPMPKDELTKVMLERAEAADEYVGSLGPDYDRFIGISALGQEFPSGPSLTEAFVTDALAPEQPMLQSLDYYSSNSDEGIVELKGKPHWSTMYCPYPDVLCSCNQQKETTLGVYVVAPDGGYTYRPVKGYEDVAPTIAPEKEAKQCT